VSILTARAVSRATIALAGSIVLACLAGVSFAANAPTVAQEYDLKAAFLFNFARYVEWPAEAFATGATPITIGILGEDPFGPSLDDIVANEDVRSRKLVVRRFASIDQVEPCHILFISASQAGHMEQIAARLAHRSVLTVGDVNGFTTRFGMIGFEMARNRVRLRINLAAAKAARLTISSMLLRQAKIMKPENGK
jgi:hypothetical protein